MKCKYKKFLKAAYIDYEEDYCGSGSGTFIIPTVTTPIIVITDNTAVFKADTAIIACATSGATIYYTLDGSTPTRSSTEYTGTITLTLSCTIKAIAVKQGMSDSEVASESYVHYLTAWKIVGNSEVHGNEIWSCGEYNATDGKYHILVQPQGGSIADIALDEPLRRVGDISDLIHYVWGMFYINRYIASIHIDKLNAGRMVKDRVTGTYFCITTLKLSNGKIYTNNIKADLLCDKIKNVASFRDCGGYNGECIALNNTTLSVKNAAIEEPTIEAYQSYFDSLGAIEIIYPLASRINENYEVLIQIAEADSYSCVTIPGSKAVEWSSFVVM